MKIHRPDQRTPEWRRIRRGIPTASWFHTLITPLGKPSENRERKKYIYRLAAERLLNHTMPDSFVSPWMERGIDLEDQAARDFSKFQDVDLDPGGFITTDDGGAGCSPDRLVKNGKKSPVEAVEIKVPSPWVHLANLCEGPGEKYKAQVQGQMLIGEFEAVHFYSWNPKLPHKHVFTTRDEKYIKTLRTLLELFNEELAMTVDFVKRQGIVIPFDADIGEMAEHFPWRD
jgi:hypothetical protein